MVVVVRKIAFFSALITVLLGIVLFLIESDTGYQPQMLLWSVIGLLHFTGACVIYVLWKKGLS